MSQDFAENICRDFNVEWRDVRRPSNHSIHAHLFAGFGSQLSPIQAFDEVRDEVGHHGGEVEVEIDPPPGAPPGPTFRLKFKWKVEIWDSGGPVFITADWSVEVDNLPPGFSCNKNDTTGWQPSDESTEDAK